MNDSGVLQETETVYRRLNESLRLFGRDYDPTWWWAIIIPVLLLGIVFVVWMYVKDSRSVRWPYAVALGTLRLTVYGILAYIFLLPARQTWERSEKRSRVLVVLDVSSSMSQISDDKPGQGSTPISRLNRITDFLSDEKVAFLKNLLAKNPVFVYRFGSRFDEEAQGFETITTDSGSRIAPMLRGLPQPDGMIPTLSMPTWSREDWFGFATYNFKPWLTRGLSEEGVKKLTSASGFDGTKPGYHEWATDWLAGPAKTIDSLGLSEADLARLKDNRDKLPDRINIASTIASGTNVPDAMLSAVNREAGNMVQAVVLFSDGRSNIGSDGAIAQLRQRAKAEQIPIFTVAVGEDVQKKAIRITDLQAPEQAPPDEPFKVIAELDGEGLAGQTVMVTLELKSPKSDKPFEIAREVKFDSAEPPHGQIEFIIDPSPNADIKDRLPDELKSDESKKKELLEGIWEVRATTPAVKGEKDEKTAHVSEKMNIKVEKTPLRILIVASAASRDMQFLLNQLLRDKADMSLFLQNTGGIAGTLTLLDDPSRVLKKFPDRLRVDEDATEKPEDRWYNLARYNVIIAFDPDWSMFTEEQVKLIQTWVDLQAGGFLHVAGPIYTKRIAHVENDVKLAALRTILPVTPGDYDLKMLSRDMKEPRRLSFPGVSPETEFLKLDDSKPDDPVAGWNGFFHGKEDAAENAKITRGFFNYYPIKEVKAGAEVIARYVEDSARANTPDKKDPPYIVTYRYGQGLTAFLGSGEMWRLRQYQNEYFERFWTKFARFLSSRSGKKQSRRGRVLMAKDFPVGGYLRFTTQLLDANLQPLPANAEPKVTIRPIELDLTPKKEGEPDGNDAAVRERAYAKYVRELKMVAKKGADGVDPGYFQRQEPLSAENYPTGIWQLEIPIPNSSDTLKQRFNIRKTNPELDQVRPDYAALARMAGDVAELAPGLTDRPSILEDLRRHAYSEQGQRLMFRFDDTQALALIPQCIDAKTQKLRNRGASMDLWDQPIPISQKYTSWFDAEGEYALLKLPMWATSWYDDKKPYAVGGLLFVVAALLSVEWLTRKLLKLA